MASPKKTLLTAKAVQGMRVDETLPDSGDYRGLRVTRTTKGRRWFYRYRVGKDLQQATIGYDLTLQEARSEFQALKTERVRGRLPKQILAVKPEVQTFTVNDMINTYVENLFRVRQKKGANDVRNLLKNVTGRYGDSL